MLFFVAVQMLTAPAAAQARGDDQPADARFRWYARDLYADLATTSCKGVVRGFDRSSRLVGERTALKAFEESVAPPAQFQLNLAKNDVLYLQRTDKLGCLADDDIRFAELHVKMTKDGTPKLIEAMRQLVPELPDIPVLQGGLSPSEAAEFRSFAKELIETTRPMCSLTTKAENRELTAVARAAVDKFRRELNDTSYAAHFAIAEADVDYRHAVTVTECDDPGSRPLAYWSQRFSKSVNRQIDAIKLRIKRT
jgi:hypothetical protein